jgi:general stress protein 26
VSDRSQLESRDYGAPSARVALRLAPKFDLFQVTQCAYASLSFTGLRDGSHSALELGACWSVKLYTHNAALGCRTCEANRLILYSQEMLVPTPAEIEAKFWAALKSDMTMMLGLDGVDEGHTRPMTAQLLEERGPAWFFASSDNAIVENIDKGHRAVATFTAKGHDLFAAIHGKITLDMNPRTIDALWSPFVAAWFPGGTSDPKLRLLRLDADRAEIWLDGSSLLTGLKMLIGFDPKEEYEGDSAKVQLSR